MEQVQPQDKHDTHHWDCFTKNGKIRYSGPTKTTIGLLDVETRKTC